MIGTGSDAPRRFSYSRNVALVPSKIEVLEKEQYSNE
jgi:hypothetical protein